MVEQHLDGKSHGRWLPPADRRQHPDRFHQHDVGHPRSTGDEGLGRADLTRVIAGYETNEDVRVNERGHEITSHNTITPWPENSGPAQYCPDTDTNTPNAAITEINT